METLAEMNGNGVRNGGTDLAEFLNQTKVVPGGGFEPPTRGFSVGALPQWIQRRRPKSIGNGLTESIKEFGSVATAFRGLGATTATNPNGPPGQMPGPGYAAKLTAIIICGMLVNEMHWIGTWVLWHLAGYA